MVDAVLTAQNAREVVVAGEVPDLLVLGLVDDSNQRSASLLHDHGGRDSRELGALLGELLCHVFDKLSVVLSLDVGSLLGSLRRRIPEEVFLAIWRGLSVLQEVVVPSMVVDFESLVIIRLIGEGAIFVSDNEGGGVCDGPQNIH